MRGAAAGALVALVALLLAAPVVARADRAAARGARLSPGGIPLVPTVVPPVPTVALPPTLAPLPTYTPPPTATAQPTNTPQPRLPVLFVYPDQGVAGVLTRVHVELGDYRPHQVAHVGWSYAALWGARNEPAVHVDANGEAAFDVDLPPHAKPDTYVLVAAQGSLTAPAGRLQAFGRVVLTAAPTGTPGEVCFLPGPNACVNLGDVVLGAVQGFVVKFNALADGGRDGVVGAVMGAALVTPDLTATNYSALQAVALYAIDFGKIAISILITLLTAVVVVDLFRAGPGRAILLALGQIILVFWYAHILAAVQHLLWEGANGLVATLGHNAIAKLEATLNHLTTLDKKDLADLARFTLSVLVAAAIVVVVVLMLGVILLTRLGTFVLLGLLFVLGPACVPLALAPQTRGVALWWFRSITALSLLPIVYILLIDGGIALALVFAKSGPAFANPLVLTGLGAMLIGALLAAPETTTGLTARAVGGAGGLLEMSKTPALALATKANKRVRGLLPHWL